MDELGSIAHLAKLDGSSITRKKTKKVARKKTAKKTTARKDSSKKSSERTVRAKKGESKSRKGPAARKRVRASSARHVEPDSDLRQLAISWAARSLQR